MTIDANGNVGIGVTSPSGPFHVREASSGVTSFSSSAWQIIAEDNSNAGVTVATPNTNKGSVFFADPQSSSAGYLQYNHATDSMTLGTVNVERMRIDASGNLLVGSTSTSLTTGTGYKFLNSASNPTPALVGTSTGSGNAAWTMYSTGASAYRFYVSWNGSVYATSTSITAISDATLKENVRDLDKGLDTVLALKPRRFDWKNGDGNDIMGFVAQEVEEVMPELVHDYQYSEDETKKALKMGDMVPSMVKAIQEQQAMIEELKAEVAALKGA